MTPSTSVGAGSSNTPGSSGIGANRRYDRTARPSHMHHPHSYAHSHSAFSKSLPSGSAQAARRLSSSRLPRPAMPPTSVSAYSTSPGGAATFGSATLYSRSPSNNSPYARSPGTAVGFAGGLRPSPYHTSSSSRVAGVNTTYAMDVPRGRERSRSRQRWAVPRPEANRAYGEDDEEEDDDDETDDEMMLPGQVVDQDEDIDVDQDNDARTARPRMAAIGIAGTSPRNDQRRFAPSSMPDYAAPASTSNRPSGAARPPAAASAVATASYASEVDDDGTGPAPDEMAEVSLIRDRLGGAANCAAFIAKLWFLVTRPGRYGRYLHWNSLGSTVILTTDPDISNEFASEVLPRLWNHANYSSFIRQMNLYGFQRLPSSRILDVAEVHAAHEAGLKAFGSSSSSGSGSGEQGSSGGGSGSINEFSTAQQLYGPHSSFLHPKFVRGREDLLPMLKPRNAKKPKTAGGAGGGAGAGVGGEGGEDE